MTPKIDNSLYTKSPTIPFTLLLNTLNLKKFEQMNYFPIIQ